MLLGHCPWGMDKFASPTAGTQNKHKSSMCMCV